MSVDPAAHLIVVDPPDGLLELNDRPHERAEASKPAGLKIDIVTIFPGDGRGGRSRKAIVGRAIERGLIDVRVHDLRDFTTDRHRVVDDVPFGGGPGMVMKPEPLFRGGGRASRRERGRTPDAVMLTSPQGARFTHAVARAVEPARAPRAAVRPVRRGRRAGRGRLATEEMSIGDYVLTGGELPALVIVDAVARLVPGVVGDEAVGGARLVQRAGCWTIPHYTRPASLRGHWTVPDGAAVGAPRGDRALAAARGAARARWSGGRICWHGARDLGAETKRAADECSAKRDAWDAVERRNKERAVMSAD